MLADWDPEQPPSQVIAHPRHLWLGRGRAGSQDLIIVACPTHTGPILTPVFVARNCWGGGGKKTVLEGVRSQQARVAVVSRTVKVSPRPRPRLTLPGLLQEDC